MTRKEAIEIFKNMLDAWDNYYTIAQSDKKREAVWLAISSLETDEAYQLEYERTTKNDSSGLDKNSKKLEKDFGESGRMTREEAKKIFFELLLFGKAPCQKEELEDLCKIVLSALEQEPVMDKIRAEIKAMSGDIETIADALTIIDKYKAES